MSSLFDSLHIENAPLGSHYQSVIAETIAKLWRRKLLVLTTMVAALTLAIIAALMTPKQYTAEAYIRGGFTAVVPEKSVTGAVTSLDAALLVETRSRIVQSHQLARHVVERLGIERLRPAVGSGRLSAWLREMFHGDVARDPKYQKDLAAARLLRSLSVKTEPRVYQIAIRYTAGNPELAALIANTFVAEYLRITALQMLSEQRTYARAALSEQLANYGDKHPKVSEARLRLQAANALFKEQLNKPSEEIRSAAGASVIAAQAVAVPSSPDPAYFIGIALFIGVVTGVGLVLLIERGN